MRIAPASVRLDIKGQTVAYCIFLVSIIVLTKGLVTTDLEIAPANMVSGERTAAFSSVQAHLSAIRLTAPAIKRMALASARMTEALQENTIPASVANTRTSNAQALLRALVMVFVTSLTEFVPALIPTIGQVLQIVPLLYVLKTVPTLKEYVTDPLASARALRSTILPRTAPISTLIARQAATTAIVITWLENASATLDTVMPPTPLTVISYCVPPTVTGRGPA